MNFLDVLELRRWRNTLAGTRFTGEVKNLALLIVIITTLFSSVSALEQKLVTVRANGTPLKKVLKQIALQMDYNIYFSPDVSGTVNTDLKSVPGFGAIDLILKTQPQALTYKVIDKTIVVGPANKLQRLPGTLYQKN